MRAFGRTGWHREVLAEKVEGCTWADPVGQNGGRATWFGLCRLDILLVNRRLCDAGLGTGLPGGLEDGEGLGHQKRFHAFAGSNGQAATKESALRPIIGAAAQFRAAAGTEGNTDIHAEAQQWMAGLGATKKMLFLLRSNSKTSCSGANWPNWLTP